METHLLFSTPIYKNEFKDVELGLLQREFEVVYQDHIKQNRFTDPWNNGRLGVTGGDFDSNILNEYNCHNFKSALKVHIDLYLKSLGDKLKDYKIVSSWMTQSLTHSYGHIHNHAPSDLAGCYYFKKTLVDGNIFFMCPMEISACSHIGSGSLLPRSIIYPANTGTLLLFPGWLNHGVDTNQSDEERISVSFNINFK